MGFHLQHPSEKKIIFPRHTDETPQEGGCELKKASSSNVKSCLTCIQLIIIAATHHPSLSAAALSGHAAHDSFSARFHGLIDISFGAPTQG